MIFPLEISNQWDYHFLQISLFSVPLFAMYPPMTSFPVKLYRCEKFALFCTFMEDKCPQMYKTMMQMAACGLMDLATGELHPTVREAPREDRSEQHHSTLKARLH